MFKIKRLESRIIKKSFWEEEREYKDPQSTKSADERPI
jgi:hypothetical protein